MEFFREKYKKFFSAKNLEVGLKSALRYKNFFSGKNFELGLKNGENSLFLKKI